MGLGISGKRIFTRLPAKLKTQSKHAEKHHQPSRWFGHDRGRWEDGTATSAKSTRVNTAKGI